MQADDRERESLALLNWMASHPYAVLGAFDPDERPAVVAKMRALAVRAEEAQGDIGEMRRVADTAYRFAQSTPGLADLLPPERGRAATVTRGISAGMHEASAERELHLEARAAQIRNHVVQCHESLERALQEFTHPEGT